MTDYTDMIRRLRCQRLDGTDDETTMLAAADALEAQGREIEGWKEEARRQAGNRDYWKARCEEGAKT